MAANPVKWLMGLVVGTVSLLLLALALAAGMGASLPRSRSVTSTAEYRQSCDSLFAALMDFEHSPAWRSDLTGARRLPDRDGRAVWELQARDGAWALEIRESVSPTRLVTATADTTQGFGGVWTFALEPLPQGARVTITEVSTIDPLLMRFVAHQFVKPHGAQQMFLRDLGRRFGESVEPQAR